MRACLSARLRPLLAAQRCAAPKASSAALPYAALCCRSGDIVRSDYEEKQAIATLQAIELVKHMAEVRGVYI